MTAKSDKPGPVLNLDALEREGEREPFAFALKGRRYEVTDPSELDWRVTAELNSGGANARYLFEQLLGEKQYKEFAAVQLPDWKAGKLLTAIGEHYGVGEPGEGNASSGS